MSSISLRLQIRTLTSSHTQFDVRTLTMFCSTLLSFLLVVLVLSTTGYPVDDEDSDSEHSSGGHDIIAEFEKLLESVGVIDATKSSPSPSLSPSPRTPSPRTPSPRTPSPRSPSNCRVEKFKVSIKSLGWDFVLNTREKINIHRCAGDCGQVPYYGTKTFHSELLRRSSEREDEKSVDEDTGKNTTVVAAAAAATACVPTRYHSLDLIYLSKDGHIRQVVVPNAIVTECSCICSFR